MDITDTPLEMLLKQLLQRQLFIYKDQRLLKQGKLLIYKQNNFNIDLQMHSTKLGKNITYALPIPFKTIMLGNNKILFDYTLIGLAKNNNKLLQQLQDIIPLRKTKFYNSIITIKMEPTL